MRFTTERFLEEKVAERSDWRTSRLSGVIGISQRRKCDNQQPPARPQMSLLSHKQSRLINGKWWHGCARLGTAGVVGLHRNRGSGVSGGRKWLKAAEQKGKWRRVKRSDIYWKLRVFGADLRLRHKKNKFAWKWVQTGVLRQVGEFNYL